MTMRILICDDEPLMAEVLARFIEPVASRVDRCGTLSAGLAMAEHGEYNIVILDLKMPGSEYEEVLESISCFKGWNAAVVVISGVLRMHLKEDVLAAGADAFISKHGSLNNQSLLIAAHIATMHIPDDSFKSETYEPHVKILKAIANAA